MSSETKLGHLAELSIKNFKSHENTHVTFTPGVNVIIGETDSGKSALFSALRWLITGKPRGSSIHTWGSNATQVGVAFSGGTVIEKKRTTGGTLFTVDGEEYKSTEGTNPPAVDAGLAISEDVSIQRQLDPPYLLSKTGGQAATTINGLVDIDVISRSQSNVVRELRATTKQINQQKDAVEQLKLAAEQYVTLPSIETAYDAAAKGLAAMYKQREQLQSTSSALSAFHTSKERLASVPPVPDTERAKQLDDQLWEITDELSKIDKTHQNYLQSEAAIPPQTVSVDSEKMRNDCRSVAQMRREVDKLRTLLSNANRTRDILKGPTVDGQCAAKLAAQRDQLQKTMAELRELQSRLKTALQRKQTHDAALAEEQTAAAELRKGNVCVLCGKPL